MKDVAGHFLLISAIAWGCSPAAGGGPGIEVCSWITSARGLATIEQSERDIPVVGQVDVAVAGGGVAGVAAALKAAREGCSVALVEERNYFGHELTATLRCVTAAYRPAPASPLADAMCQDLLQARILVSDRLDPVKLRWSLHGKIAEQPRIKVYLFSLPSGAVKQGERVCGLTITNRSGRQILMAKAVVDATPEARIAAAAGAGFLQGMAGRTKVRRWIAVRRPDSLPLGPRPVSPDLQLDGDRVAVHDRFLELVMAADIGEDAAAGLSRALAETLANSHALREKLAGEGTPLEDFRPAPEVWIDRVPAVACRAPLSERAISALDFTPGDAFLPARIEGLVIAGRTLSPSPTLGSLQSLLCAGEAAGRMAARIASAGEPPPEPGAPSEIAARAPAWPAVRELLQGIESGTRYPVMRQAAVRLPVRGRYDVLVVGGGTSGALAAIAAARQGARVALLEVLPNLGGISSNRVNGYYWGVPWKSRLSEEIDERIQLVPRTGPSSLEKVGFSGEEKKRVLQELALRAGVRIEYQSFGAGAVVRGNQVIGVVVENACGRHVLLAKTLVDATGHADIAAAAGAATVKGRSRDGFLHEIEHGPLRDPTHIEDISRAYVQNPSSAISLNDRESRRIVGDYVLSFEDAIHERLFSDTICRWRSNYDSHFPHSANQDRLAQDWIAMLGLFRRPIVGSIPFRCLLPRDLDNLLVVGKAYSASHDALIGARMQRDLQHLGEAAGVAAAMACTRGIAVRAVPVERLQAELMRLGVLRAEDLAAAAAGRPSPERVRRAVGQLGTDRALDGMVELYLAGQDAVPQLRPLLASPAAAPREEAALLLGLAGDRAAIPALLALLEERNPRRFTFTLPNASSRASLPLYYSAVILLGRFQASEAIPGILELLREPACCPPDLASFAIVALGHIGDRRAASAIRPYLSVRKEVAIDRENLEFEVQWGVCTNAARVLARLGDPAGIPVLIELLGAEQSLLRDYAHRLLEEITGERLGKDRRAWEAWWRRHSSVSGKWKGQQHDSFGDHRSVPRPSALEGPLEGP